MFRVFQQAVSAITIVGYFLAVTWGPAWHDHHHGHCHHAQTEVQGQPQVGETPLAHACCSHHHHDCQTQDRAESNTGPSPCPAPLHDDDCVVCQVFAHPPLPAPEIELIDSAQPLVEKTIVLCPPPAFSLPAAYDSRGPPLV